MVKQSVNYGRKFKQSNHNQVFVDMQIMLSYHKIRTQGHTKTILKGYIYLALLKVKNKYTNIYNHKRSLVQKFKRIYYHHFQKDICLTSGCTTRHAIKYKIRQSNIQVICTILNIYVKIYFLNYIKIIEQSNICQKKNQSYVKFSERLKINKCIKSKLLNVCRNGEVTLQIKSIKKFDLLKNVLVLAIALIKFNMAHIIYCEF